MVVEIKKYQAKSGEVTITQCADEDRDTVVYWVQHSSPEMCFQTRWYKWKEDAIAHAQFLSRY